jgi:hypothetical protein
MSSMKTTINLSNSGMNMEFIRYMKCAGALVNPNDNPILIQPIPGGEGSVRNVFRVDADLVITQTKIDLGKDLSTGKLVKKNVDSHGGGSSMVGGRVDSHGGGSSTVRGRQLWLGGAPMIRVASGGP